MNRTWIVLLGLILALQTAKAAPPTIFQAIYTLDFAWDYETFSYVETTPYLAEFSWWENNPTNNVAYYLEISTDNGATWCVPGAECDGFGGSPSLMSWNWSIYRVQPGLRKRFIGIDR